MKKILYFTVEKELDSTGESLSGVKIISVYDIINNKPERFAEVETDISTNSEEAINEYLEDNGYGDDEYKFINL